MVEYSEGSVDELAPSPQLRSPVRGLKSGSSTPSPAKLAPTHSLFMASIDSSPTRKRNVGDVQMNDGVATGNGNGGANFRSSTRVIESLHDQIDTLTNTNLQLTIQSNNLLNKLENAQQRESKLLESTSSLKHENDNLGSMLNRKTRKVKELEEELGKIRLEYKSALHEKSQLEEQWEHTNENEKYMEQKMEMIQAQYDGLVDSQKYYKAHYKSQLGELQEEVEKLKNEQINYLEGTSREGGFVDLKLQEFDSKYENLQQMEQMRLQFLNDKCDSILKQFDLESWLALYKESKKMALTYAERMGLDLPGKFLSYIEDPILVDLESRQQQFANTSGKITGSDNGAQPLKMVKLRNRSNGTSNNNTTSKRSSFYGGSKQVPKSSLPGSLPGVRRSSSRRTNSGKSDTNSSAESSPILPSSSSRNASSPSPRMVNSSTFRKKADN